MSFTSHYLENCLCFFGGKGCGGGVDFLPAVACRIQTLDCRVGGEITTTLQYLATAMGKLFCLLWWWFLHLRDETEITTFAITSVRGPNLIMSTRLYSWIHGSSTRSSQTVTNLRTVPVKFCFTWLFKMELMVPTTQGHLLNRPTYKRSLSCLSWRHHYRKKAS